MGDQTQRERALEHERRNQEQRQMDEERHQREEISRKPPKSDEDTGE